MEANHATSQCYTQQTRISFFFAEYTKKKEKTTKPELKKTQWLRPAVAIFDHVKIY